MSKSNEIVRRQLGSTMPSGTYKPGEMRFTVKKIVPKPAGVKGAQSGLDLELLKGIVMGTKGA